MAMLTAVLGTVWGCCFAVGLVTALNNLAIHQPVNGLADVLIAAGAGGLGWMIGSAARWPDR